MSNSARIHPAATVLVLRDGARSLEVFMVRRHEQTAFMGGAYVFPGGRLDVADRDAADPRWCDGITHAAAQLGELPPAEAVAYHVAAIRELFEEAGLLLARGATGGLVSLAGRDAHARFKQYRSDLHSGSRSLRDIADREGLRLALETLVAFAHWVTPPTDARRFDTRFFVTRVPSDQVPAHDETETTHSTWIAPADAIARGEKGLIVLPIPTWTTLRELEAFGSVDEAIAWARQRRIARCEPKFVHQNGERMLVLPGDPLNPEPWADAPTRETRFVLVQGRWRAQRPRT